ATITSAGRIASPGMFPDGVRCLTKSATDGGGRREAAMAKKISVETRVELVRAIGERYRAGTRKEKLRILDEFVAVTGYHRKHGIRVLNTEGVDGFGEA